MSDNNFQSIQSIGRPGLIDELSAIEGFKSDVVVKGIGDDAAVLDETEMRAGLLSSESFLEGVDFDLVYTPLHYLGYKVVSMAVSDIYAMNGQPEAMLVNLSLPNKISVEMTKQIYEGVQSAGREFGVQLAGGDLTASHQVLAISVSVYGRAEKEHIVYRSGARVDDAICVSGDLGGAMAGLRILMREKEHWKEHAEDHIQPDLSDYEYVVKRQLVPAARKDVVQLFEDQDIRPTSLIDISQGLLHELNRLTEASSVGAYIYQAALPIAIETRQVADEMKEDVDKYALYGGEDLELLFTLPKPLVEKLSKYFNDFAVIGKVTDREDGLKMQTPDGDVVFFEEESSSSDDED